MNPTAGPEENVSRLSKFRQKYGRAAGEGLRGNASVLSENGAPALEHYNLPSRQPQATATSNEETSKGEHTQLNEVEKHAAESNIDQRSYEVGKSTQKPWNPPAAEESAPTVTSCETVKAVVEITTRSEGGRVSKFRAKLSETKEKGEFPDATKKGNLGSSVSAQNKQAPTSLPTPSQTEFNFEKNIIQPDQGALNINAALTSLSESKTLPRLLRPPVGQISCPTPENSEMKNGTQLLNLETNVLDVPQAHGEATVESNIGPGHASTIFDKGVKQRLKSLKLQKLCEDDLKVLIEYCHGWFEAKSNSPIEQVPRESLDNAGRAFKALKSYVDKVEGVFNEHVCLPQGQFSQQVTPLRHDIMRTVPPAFREIIASRVEEFANEYEKRNAEIFRQEEQVVKALIGTAGDYFEEEAAFAMKSDYFEAHPLSTLLSPIEEQTKQSFLHACDVKFATRLLDHRKLPVSRSNYNAVHTRC